MPPLTLIAGLGELSPVLGVSDYWTVNFQKKTLYIPTEDTNSPPNKEGVRNEQTNCLSGVRIYRT